MPLPFVLFSTKKIWRPAPLLKWVKLYCDPGLYCVKMASVCNRIQPVHWPIYLSITQKIQIQSQAELKNLSKRH